MRVRLFPSAFALLALLAAVGCGDGSGGSPLVAGDSEPAPGGCSESFDGTFAAIQEVVFERHGCTADTCHGSARSGGLDLRPPAAYASLIEVPATGSSLVRVSPGDDDLSYLYLKLAAKTRPGSVEVAGSPMPIGQPALDPDELELLRVWIKGGAPEHGSVLGAEGLVDGCVPPPEPVTIRPLDPPPPGEGIQLVMPTYDLPAASEREVCFAQYYDVSDRVPARYLDETGMKMRVRASRLRQDPESHHLILLRYEGPAGFEDFGVFTCHGGERAGQACEPTDPESCGSGACASPVVDAVGCVGFGPPGVSAISLEQVLVAQQAQETQELAEGVFAEIPTRGLWVWNSHAFNVTTSDHVMHARINYLFADDQRYPVRRIFDISKIFGQSTPPYGSETICNDYVLPRGARVFNLISHTHRHGKRFWIEAPDGRLIYESFVYNDPLNASYDPPLVFDSPSPAERTLHYCATYENGLAEDGSPDPATVKRRSTTPPNALRVCEPVACTAGRIGAACTGAEEAASCDSAPGAGDGECDACVLEGGVSTEDEMFILLGAYFVPGATP